MSASWSPFPGGRRAAPALLISLLFHGALLAVLPDWRLEPKPEERLLQAFVVDTPAPPPPPDFQVPPPVVEVPPPVFAPPPPPPEPVVQPRPKPRPEPAPRPKPRPRPEPAPQPAPEPPPPVAPEPAPAAPPVEPVVAPPPPPPPPPPPRPDPRLLERYGDALSQRFASEQSYPRLAAMRGWEGEVLLRLTIARTGGLRSVQVLRSSGHEVLDKHAIALVEGSGQLPKPPKGFDDEDLEITVPVRYRLRSG
ncbi:MAG: energy transducer TonB [Rhodocyclaceae bacterium]|nr:energy transducer TonB [Rhodocyclaceae bacterium]